MANDRYLNTVNSAKTAKTFLISLHDNGLLFHPEESAFDCLSHHDLGTMAFSAINQNMASALVYLPDACQTALDIMRERV